MTHWYEEGYDRACQAYDFTKVFDSCGSNLTADGSGDSKIKLQGLNETWQTHQPPIFAEEQGLVLDMEPYDLSLARLEEAKACVERLRALRLSKRGELLGELRRLWERFGVETIVAAQRQTDPALWQIH